MSDNREKLIARIRALLSLAGNNTNEHERDAAMAKVQDLLIQYKIDMREVGSAVDTEVQVGEWMQVTRNGQWSRRIAASVGKLYFCSYVYTPLGKKIQHHFIGTETNGKVAAEVASFVIESVYREGARQMRERGEPNSYWTTFVNEASLTIQQRVSRLIAESQRPHADVSSSRALVVVDMYKQAADAAAAYMANMKLREVAARQMQRKSLEAMEAGRKFGNNINLNLSVKGQTVNQRRIK